MCQSEVAELRRKILEEYRAMKQGPSALALTTSKHAFIDAHLKRVDGYHSQLVQYIGEQEATKTIYELYNEVMG